MNTQHVVAAVLRSVGLRKVIVMIALFTVKLGVSVDGVEHCPLRVVSFCTERCCIFLHSNFLFNKLNENIYGPSFIRLISFL